MLRDQGAWYRLEVGDVFTVHVGWDRYLCVGSDRPCADAVARTRELGLFPEPLTASPYAAEFDEPDVTGPVDEHFWIRVHTAPAARPPCSRRRLRRLLRPSLRTGRFLASH
ncbi:hypothetical protein [Streptomyces sp. NPDC017890]|uniref:hypothetical protein n=1 Tax=Streptomyces sp. NPDC017890 TaxID=3365015 RepID=UPI0037AAB600